MRADLYTLIHKTQRFHLFNLANEIGGADFTHEKETERVTSRLREMIEHLRDHADNEEIYIHPLFQRLGVFAFNHFENDHRDLEKKLQNLEMVLNDQRWTDLYSEYTQFLGQYIVHLSEEETAQKDILWTKYDDETLLSVFNRFKSERSPRAAQKDLELMLPALSVAELARMFLSMKASVPAQVFQGAYNLAESLMTPERWRKFLGKIS